ncbi:MAG: tetratricopeptide repeat protein [Deltaproteobacteria bacterium]|nr:tetratricopeptide repeat protein [Deltaproteobacteria bacterium]
MASDSDKNQWLAVAFLLILGCLIYANTLSVPFYLDDYGNIVENPYVHLSSLKLKNILDAGFKSPCSNRPIANISFALNYYIHQDRVWGYHIVNIAIHALTAVFFFLLTGMTLRISETRRPATMTTAQPLGSFMISLSAALLWLVHPIHTQSVTYVVQRMNSMAAMFYVMAFFFYVKGRLAKKNNARLWFGACVLCGLLAIGSKEVAATLPFFILLYEWYFFQDLSKAWLKRYSLPILYACLFFGLLVMAYLGKNPIQSVLSGYRIRDFSLTERVLTEFRVVVFYISLLLFPRASRFSLEHDFVVSHTLMNPPTTLVALGVMMGGVLLAILPARKERLISFCILWFFGNLAIESSVIGLEIIFEHRTYMPSMFFVLLVVLVVSRMIKKKVVLLMVLCAVLLTCSYWTHKRNVLWGDPVAFWQDCVRKSEGQDRSHYHLANALREQDKLDGALREYMKALRINPRLAGAHFGAGRILWRIGRTEEAAGHYLAAVSLKPDYAEAHNNLGAIYYMKGDLNKAIEHYSKAVKIRPDFAEARYNLGLALRKTGRRRGRLTQSP